MGEVVKKNQIGFCILECEDIKERLLFNFHKKFIDKISKPKILVLLWTTNDLEKRKKYQPIIKEYFENLGSKEILFLEENVLNIERKFRDFDVLYLPGGDTSCLLENLRKNPKVINDIKNFKGLIIGNSAGAIALCERGYSIKEEKIVEYTGLGLLKVKVFVHFKLDYLNLLNKKEIICIGDNEGVTFIK